MRRQFACLSITRIAYVEIFDHFKVQLMFLEQNAQAT